MAVEMGHVQSWALVPRIVRDTEGHVRDAAKSDKPVRKHRENRSAPVTSELREVLALGGGASLCNCGGRRIGYNLRLRTVD